MSRVTVEPLIPANFVPKPLSSSSNHIVRKRLVEILPQEQVTFSPGGNSRITFNISSATDFLIGLESFIRMELRTIGTATAANDPFRHLNTGGGHALFCRMEIRLPNGTQIELIDQYAKWYALNSLGSHSRQHVDFMEASAGDSSNWRAYMDPYHVDVPRVAGDLTAANWRYTGLFNGADAAAAQDLYYTGVVPVGAVSQNDTANAADVAAGLDTQYTNSGLIWPARTRVCKNGGTALTTAGFTLTMKPFMQFLSMSEIIPLALMQGGFQLVLDLAPAVQAMALHEDIAYNAAETLDYNILVPRFFASYVQPSEEVMNDYIQLFNAGQLNYNYLGVRHFLNVQNGGNSTMSFPLNVNVRSARAAITGGQNYKANTATQSATNANSSFGYDATGRWLKLDLLNYQYQSGSDNFPERAVQMRISSATDDPIMAEAFSWVAKTYGHHGSTLFEPRFASYEWYSLNFDDATDTNESFRLQMCSRLDRADDTLVGYDLSINPLNAIFESAAAYTTAAGTNDRYLHSYITYDVILSISSDGVIRRI